MTSRIKNTGFSRRFGDNGWIQLIKDLYLKFIPILAVFAVTVGSFGQTVPSHILHKVEMRDPVAERQLIAQGGRLIADYGSFRLYETEGAPPNGELRDNYNKILLNAKTLDTSTPEVRSLQTSMGTFSGNRLHLVHFAGPPQAEWRDSILATGARIVSYIPENAYLIYGDPSALGRVRQLAATEPQVQWHGDYLDNYKIHPLARASKTGRFAIQLVADAVANTETIKLLDVLKLAPLDRRAPVLDYVNVVGTFAPGDLPKIAARPDVISIQPYATRRKLCERQDQIITGAVTNGSLIGPGYLAWLESKGFTQRQFGLSDFAVDVSDSGIDDGTTSPNHFGLHEEGNLDAASRVRYNKLFGTPNPGSTLAACDGHGNINAHIVAGYDDYAGFPFEDSDNYHYGLGVCPFVTVGSSVVFDPVYFTSPNYTTLQSTAYHNGVRISNNSWGGEGPDGGFGIYDVDAQEYDALVRDAEPSSSPYATTGNQEMVIVFAAGNAGVDTNSFTPIPGTIESPGSAKNVITVGASENVQPFNAPGGAPDNSGVYDFEADNADGLVDFSSKGPCQDGRHKPDLVAPGTHVSGGVPQAANPGPDGTAEACFIADNQLKSKKAGVSGGPINSRSFPFFPNRQEFYTVSSGTSHAAPCVCGACALLRQYFINQGLAPPSPAMTKAFLMNSARYLDGPNAGGSLWSDAQGMGEVNLGTAFDGAPRFLRDESPKDMFTTNGQSRTFTGEIADPSQPFRVTVAWTDAPGNTFGAAYNNDLDLTVQIGGVRYLGNVFNGAFSTAGGSPDLVNNVESVFLPAGIKGEYTVTISAENINSIGTPNSANQINQDFALVIDNSSAAQDPVIAAASATVTSQSCLNNGALSPGQRATVNLALQNVGGSATANLIATLLTINGVVGPSGPQTYGALAAGGAAVTAPFTFSADGVCGGTVNAVLQLADGATNLGTVNFTFQLGQLTQSNLLIQSFGDGIPNSWTGSSSVAQDSWAATNDGATGTVAFVGDAGSTNEAILISPPVAISGNSPQLTFHHRYNLESPGGAIAYDGGVLEIKIGDGAFQDILAAGGNFLSNGYNTSIIAEGGNPLLSHLAWSGNSGGYVTTVATLPAAASGQTVQVEWICATDKFNDPTILRGDAGWWINGISLREQTPSCCASAPFVSTTILSPADGAQTTLVTNIISGSGTPGDEVVLSDNSISNSTLVVDSNGFFQASLALTYGTNVLTAQQQPVDPSDSAPVNVVLTPSAPLLRVSPISGVPAFISGAGVAGASVEIFDNGSASPAAIFTADANGQFSGDVALSLGTHSLTAAEIVNGITSAISTPILIDVVKVPAPVIIFPTNGFVTNNASLTIQGEGTNGASFTIYDNGAQIGTTTAGANGAFNFAAIFANGAHVLTVAQSVGGVLGGPGPPVTVTIQLAPAFVIQPQNQNAFIGGSATFSATAYGAPLLQYYWQRNGDPIAGATHSTLTLNSINANSVADYQLVVRNAYGLDISDQAALTLVTNPYPPLAGPYSGLFMQTPAEFQSSGLVNLSLTPMGRFTGKINSAGAYSFSGALSPEGLGTASVGRGAKLPPLTLSLNFHLTNDPPQFGGTASDGNWTADLRANRAVFSAAHPSPWQGKDTAIFGNGYGRVTVGANGYAALNGFLPDNTLVAPAAASVSEDGQWPLYAPLYGKAGALFGWLDFSNGSATNFSGELVWVRTNSFTNLLTAAGARLAAGAPFLGLTNLQIVLTGGDLPAPLTNALTLLKSGVLKPVDATILGLSLSVAPSTGLVTGRFLNPNTHTPEQIKGVVFQAQTNASGFFRDANGSGGFVISAAGH